jgi:hypothetical protein
VVVALSLAISSQTANPSASSFTSEVPWLLRLRTFRVKYFSQGEWMSKVRLADEG